MFSWGQYYISNSQSFLHYIALACHFEAPSLPNFDVYSFFVLHSRPFSVFSILLSIQCNFLHQYLHFLHQMRQSPSTFLIALSASFFCDICSFQLSFLRATHIYSFVVAAMFMTHSKTHASLICKEKWGTVITWQSIRNMIKKIKLVKKI